MSVRIVHESSSPFLRTLPLPARLIGVRSRANARRALVFGAGDAGEMMVREAEADLSRYLQTVAMINVALGTMLAIAFHLLGLPGGVVLGAMVGLLNFVPLLGPWSILPIVAARGLK